MTSILNREFQHPPDGWYMIEPKGEHPNRTAGVVQVIDDEAARSLVGHFNQQADQPDFPGLLIDHEHFSHDSDKETRAFGWLTRLVERKDGIYGRIRWSDTGRAAVDGGDYRFFSTEYANGDLLALNTEPPAKNAKDSVAVIGGRGRSEGDLKRVRPVRLAGLTLTNRPNNKGGKPITNRLETGGQRLEGLQPAACSLYPNPRIAGAAGAASATSHQHQPGHHTPLNQREPMNRLTEKLGLAAEAGEDALLDAVTRIINRATTAETALAGAQKNAETLQAENQALREGRIEADLELHQHRFAPEQRALWKDLLTLNREIALQALAALPEQRGAVATPAPRLVVNRATARTPADSASPPPGDPIKAAVEDYRIKNRCSFEEAWNAVKREKPELFKSE